MLFDMTIAVGPPLGLVISAIGWMLLDDGRKFLGLAAIALGALLGFICLVMLIAAVATQAYP